MMKQIKKDVWVDETATIYENVFFIGKCKVGKNTVIYPNSTIKDSFIGDNCEIKCSFIENSVIQNNVQIGPFAHLRPQSFVKSDCKIGNFVEIKNAMLFNGTKASHLAYVGDAIVGKDCNIGCGAIFVNYDGQNKNMSVVGNKSFVGSNCNLVSPLKVAQGSYICAGTTLTQNTNDFDFVVGRSRETIKPKRAKKYMKKE